MYEVEIEKLEKYLPYENNSFAKLQQMDALRYYYKENEKDADRVKYNAETKDLDYSKSIQMGIEITKYVPKVLHEIEEENKIKAIEIMKNNYYYLAGYLFSYYAVAIEFGIAPEKQFIAPRTSVLGPIAKKLERFYYKPKGVMTISMPQGTGKEQPLSSNILTPDGWVKMGEVNIGTKVIASDGSVCNVTGVYPKGVKDVYRVSFRDGTYVDCGLEHLWEVTTCEDRRNRKPARILNTKQMLNNFILGKNSSRPYHNYAIRLVKPIQFESKLAKEDVKPYIIGALIGDGGLSNECIKFTSSDEEIINRISRELFEEDKISKYSGDNYDYGISAKEVKRNKKGHLLKSKTMLKLEEYGMMGKRAEEKTIPKKYLYGSVEERIELLQGIMDTDGYNSSRDCLCEFDTVSEQLCKDVLELIRGLGGKASYSTKQGKYKKEDKEILCQKVYRVYFTIKGINPFYLKRKAEKFTEPTFNYQKIITDIKKVRQEECQCIMIDHPEHLYVTDGYTLTHNTELGKRFMSFCVGKSPDLPNMMVSYSASIAKDKFYNGIMTLVEDENGNFQKIFPKLKNVLKSAETMSLDYRNDEKVKPHSEYTLYCCGFDGGITGRTRAHNVLYVDDLIKNIEEARNKDVLDKKWEEFTGTLKKRMQGNCKLLIIGTIFSINDPLSRIIKYYQEKDPDRIEVIRVPGLNENNETNFNYKYGFALTTEQLLEDKDLMDTVSFECLIQQHPIERLGIVFSEEELTKFLEEPDYGLERRIAAVDVAWGGGDSLAMPICSEYDNHDVYLTDVIFSQGKKEETIPMVVNAIINYQITTCHFEANNGGDMYAEKVEEELKKKNYRCNITWSKVPTTKSKLDRILACQGAIKGAATSDYRLLIKERKLIRNHKMYNDFIDELTKFNQSPSVQGKQHDDSCFEENTLIATEFGWKKIKDIRRGMKVITPLGLRKVVDCGITGYKEIIEKDGLKITPKHKVFNSKQNEFKPIDTFTSLKEYDIISLGGLIKWKKKLLNLMERNIKETQKANTTLNILQQTKKEKNARSYIELCGNITMDQSPKDIKYIIKTKIQIIMTLKTWSVFQLGNIYQNMRNKCGKILKLGKNFLNKCEEIQKDNKNVKHGTVVQKELSGIDNMQKEVYLKTNMKNKEYVNGVKKNTQQEWQQQSIARSHANKKQLFIEKIGYVKSAKKYFTQPTTQESYAHQNAEKSTLECKEKKKIPVYNLTVEEAGCYYANGVLVSNCDSLASLFTNVLGCARVGVGRSTKSRADLGI